MKKEEIENLKDDIAVMINRSCKLNGFGRLFLALGVYEDIIKAILTKKEIKVLDMRFGLNGDGTNTLEEVAKYLNVTRERIRQIEGKALEKIKLYLYEN